MAGEDLPKNHMVITFFNHIIEMFFSREVRSEIRWTKVESRDELNGRKRNVFMTLLYLGLFQKHEDIYTSSDEPIIVNFYIYRSPILSDIICLA